MSLAWVTWQMTMLSLVTLVGCPLFMFSMIGITLADNLIMIFVFWELVGFSSYLVDRSLFYY